MPTIGNRQDDLERQTVYSRTDRKSRDQGAITEQTELRTRQSCLFALRSRLLREGGMVEEALREDVMTAGDTSAVPSRPADQDVEGFDEQIILSQNEDRLNYGAQSIVDDSLAEVDYNSFESGTHTETIRLKYSGCNDVEHPLVANFARQARLALR